MSEHGLTPEEVFGVHQKRHAKGEAAFAKRIREILEASGAWEKVNQIEKERLLARTNLEIFRLRALLAQAEARAEELSAELEGAVEGRVAPIKGAARKKKEKPPATE